MALYSRVCELTVIDRGSDDIRQVRDLRFTFDIEKTSDFLSNTSRISIYNMNQDNRDFLQSNTLDVIFKAGYAGVEAGTELARIIFVGNVERVSTERVGSDFVTTLECEDSAIEINDSRLDKTYNLEGGTPIRVIINDLIKALNLVVNEENIQGIPNDVFINPVVVSGPVKETLTNILKKIGLTWSVQDNEIHIGNQDRQNILNSVLISKDTGLLGIPIKREEGIEFVSLLNPLLRPTETVKIESEFIGSGVDGNFVITRAVYQGDTREGPWEVRCEALEGVEIE